MNEKEIEVSSGGATLSGTLTLPGTDGRYPAVVMVHGSGPLDRNSNAEGENLDDFKFIAKALADNGIAGFRYDKRGCGKSSGDYTSAGHNDLVVDAMHCLDALSQSSQIDENSLYLLGHSEGCIIAPQVSRQRSAVAGMILLCPFIESIESTLMRQAGQTEKEIALVPGFRGRCYRALLKLRILSPTRQQAQLIRKVMATDDPVVHIGKHRVEAKWLREVIALDPPSIFAASSTPMLLVAGSKDLQCNPQDIFDIAKTTPGPSEAMVIEGMTHILRVDENPASVTGYSDLVDKPMEPAVIDKLIEWVQQRQQQSIGRTQSASAVDEAGCYTAQGEL